MKKLLLILLTVTSCFALAAPKEVVTHLGYVYPAGAQAGQTLTVTIGGKGLSKTKQVLISGEGVEAKVIEHIKNYKRRLQEHVRFLRVERSGKENKKERRFGPSPTHAYFDQWLHYSDAEFRQMFNKFNKKERVQRNMEIDELVVLEITIAEGAKPGLREIYLTTDRGASNPIRFMVDRLPEVYEQEPNDNPNKVNNVHSLPFIANGQVQPGDTDHFRFSAEKGQKLVIQTQARELIPYLADAVPGWFQAVVSLKDSKGNEIAFSDDYKFNPDPVLFYEVENTGEYTLSIHDSIFRGREDFVYRISVGELPFVTSIFPLGGQEKQTAQVDLSGWNLPYDKVALSTNGSVNSMQTGMLNKEGWYSNSIKYAINAEDELFETNENNNSIENAQNTNWPVILNGKIEHSGDTDFYQFEAKQGDMISAEVFARRLHSPMDPLIRLYGPDKALIKWQDDAEEGPNTGMLTHHADPALVHTVKTPGSYYIQIADTQFQGGDAYAYRVQLNHQQADFDLYVTPSAIRLSPGGTALVQAHVVRKNGFKGAVRIGLFEAPTKLSVTGNRILPGQSSTTLVLRAPQKTQRANYVLNFVGTAKAQGKDIVKLATPADQKTQAFITPHIVEAQQTHLVVNGRKQFIANVKPIATKPIELRSGETQVLKIPARMRGKREIHFALKHAPKGISLNAERREKDLALSFSVEEGMASGEQGNLIVEVYAVAPPKKDKKSKKPNEYSLGYLPAIPFKVM